jgi:NADH:ubiquinone oxidoreductase subunit 6 (subunit J)
MLEIKYKNLSNDIIQYLPMGFFFGGVLLLPILNIILTHFDQNMVLKYYLKLLGIILADDFVSYFWVWVFKTFGVATKIEYLNVFDRWLKLSNSLADIEIYAKLLYSCYVLQFLIIGLVLLLVLIGVVYLINNYSLNNNKLNQTIFSQLSRKSRFFF